MFCSPTRKTFLQNALRAGSCPLLHLARPSQGIGPLRRALSHRNLKRQTSAGIRKNPPHRNSIPKIGYKINHPLQTKTLCPHPRLLLILSNAFRIIWSPTNLPNTTKPPCAWNSSTSSSKRWSGIATTKKFTRSLQGCGDLDRSDVEGAADAQDYAFRFGSTQKFFVKAKKPSINLEHDTHTAFQVRRYAWLARLYTPVLPAVWSPEPPQHLCPRRNIRAGPMPRRATGVQNCSPDRCG